VNRKVVVSLVLVLGAIGVSFAISQGRSLGPTGAATGASGGCAGSSELQALEEGPAEELQFGAVLDVAASTAPTPDIAAADEAVEGLFVVKLRTKMLPRVEALNNTLETGVAPLDDDLASIADAPRRFRQGDTGVWVFESDSDWNEVMERLSEHDEVEWIEPVFAYSATAVDPLKPFQWNVGLFGSADATGVVVAVVDSGVSMGGTDGIGGFVDGYDFVDDDSDPADGNGHGTHVAGTIAGTTDNGVGVAAIAPGAKIMPVRVLDDEGSGTSTDVAAGIEWAVDNGADVINLSLGGSSYSALIADAVEYAYDNNVVVVAAAGNDGFTDAISYPAANDGAIAVGAVGLDYVVTAYSNKGDELDVVAPGGDLSEDNDEDGYNDGILQETLSGEGYAYAFYEGTSMAAPHVAAMAAILIANGNTDVDDVTSAILETAEDLGDEGWDSSYGYGYADLEAALEWTAPEEEEAESFTINNATYSIRSANPRRADVTWKTEIASDTCVSWGTVETCKTRDPVYAKNHRRVVGVNPCKDRPYTLTSVSEDGYEVTQKLIIEGVAADCNK
jgi:subtilisin family serine protease